jgi:phenylpropionate dioxygenase-like ring-hydroxylating dioxygenase large terminal subunit
MNNVAQKSWQNWTRRADQGQRSGPTYQEAIANDRIAPPEDLRQAFPLILDNPVGRERYVSHAFHRREVEGLWRHVWQFACREEEIPEPGDTVVYEVAGASFLIVRGDDERIRAFRNTCLHRGTKLCTSDTSVARFRCPFHGFTWSLQGELIDVPSRWDFPDLDDEAARLREVRIGTWGGFVFINPDSKGASLEEFLEVMPRHFTGALDYSEKYIAARFRKILPCNWKLGIEAFIESYHSLETHPQVVPFSSDENAQYDVLGHHVSRFLIASGLQSSQVSEALSEHAILESLIVASGGAEAPELAEGMTARAFVAEMTKQITAAASGRDYSELSEAETIDANQYSLFPNMVIFRSLSFPVVYRFRPNGHDHTTCIFDLYFMKDVPISGERPYPSEAMEIGTGTFADAMLSYSAFLGRVYDQDVSNLAMQQEGMGADVDAPMIISREMETRVKHLEATIDWYLDRYAPLPAESAAGAA